MEKAERIAALVIAVSGLLTALCLGLRKLHLKRIKIFGKCCQVDMKDATSSESSQDIENMTALKDIPHHR